MFIVAGLVAFFVFLTGCTGGIRRDFASLERTVQKHDEGITTLFSQQALAADLLKQTAERLEKVRVRTEESHSRISALQSETRQKLADIERRMTGAHATTSALNARVGTMEDAGGFDHKNRIFRIGPFPVGKAEIPSGWSSNGIKKAVADGWAIKAIVGFADDRPFKEDSSAKNLKLATSRAKATWVALSELPDVLVEGRGSTDKFGGLEANRSVVVYLERDGADNVYIPLRGPVGPIGSQGVKGDLGPAGPPGIVTVAAVPPPPAVAVNSAPASPAPAANAVTPAASIPTPPTSNP